MANVNHLEILKKGSDSWITWRQMHPKVKPDLSDANLHGGYFGGLDFSNTNLKNVRLGEADLNGANFDKANLQGADLNFTDLMGTSFRSANLGGAALQNAKALRANFQNAILDNAILTATLFTSSNLSGANLVGAFLAGAQLINTNLTNANISDCNVYGISVWDADLTNTKQKDLIITRDDSPEQITVDNLEVAQFMYLLLNNKQLRNTITSITTKSVLILGRFGERKPILDAIRDKLRLHNYIPILFDFERTPNRNLTETISLLAHMVRFIIADITEPRSIPHELQRIIPDLPSVAIVPILEKGYSEYPMFNDFRDYAWVLNLYEYENKDKLLKELQEKVIDKAEAYLTNR